MRTMFNVLLFVIAASASVDGYGADLRPAGLFTDNMVLQQGLPVKVWGTSVAGREVSVGVAGRTGSAKVTGDGRWMVVLPALGYGGPYVMQISDGKDTLYMRNVMVGEVWLASGQSNMNFSVGRPVKDVEAVVAGAQYPMIREFDVQQQLDKKPLDGMQPGRWEVCDTAHVRKFSAVAYFFARELFGKRGVAIGIIHSSWSGTRIEAWISAAALGKDTAFSALAAGVGRDTTDWPVMQARAMETDARRTGVVASARQGIDMGVHTVGYPDTGWKSLSYPIRASRGGAPYYSLVWFRKTVSLSAGAEKLGFRLHLGKVSESDITYVNGVEVGRSKGLDQTEYDLPAGILVPGKNVIAIRLMNAWGSGQIGSPVDSAWLESRDAVVRRSITGEWKCHAGIEPALPWGNSYSNQPTALYNGMIHPLAPYGIRGFLWYQGEGNAGNPEDYRKLQPMMIRNWRALWGEGDIPFLFVQLPNLNGAGTWPRMREAQAASLKLANTGMAVTIDVGNQFDVHPNDKAPVGRRLALLAGHVAYHDSVVYSGPTVETVQKRGRYLFIRFGNTGTGLVLRGSSRDKTGGPRLDSAGSGFFICGADSVFHPAFARAMRNTVELFSAAVKEPVAVRYAYEADPKVTLFNKEGLPAAPFRTDAF